MTPRGVIRAVDGVSFDIDAGETVTIIGESGSGKSTTAMALLRLLPDDLAVISGSAQIDGQDVVGTRKHIGDLRGRSVALIPQDPMTALNPIATVGKQMVEAIRHAHPSLSQGAGRANGLSTSCARCTSAPPSDGSSPTRTSSPAACSSACSSRWRCRPSPGSSSPTSPPRPSTSPCRPASSTCSWRCRSAPASPSC